MSSCKQHAFALMRSAHIKTFPQKKEIVFLFYIFTDKRVTADSE